MSAPALCPVDHELLFLQDCYWLRLPPVSRAAADARSCPLCGLEMQRHARPGALLRASLGDVSSAALSMRTRQVLELLCDWLCKHIDTKTPEPSGIDPALASGDMRAFGLRVRARREAAGLTRQQLAERIGICAATLRNVETSRHRPSPSVLARLMRAPELRDDALDPSLR